MAFLCGFANSVTKIIPGKRIINSIIVGIMRKNLESLFGNEYYYAMHTFWRRVSQKDF